METATPTTSSGAEPPKSDRERDAAARASAREPGRRGRETWTAALKRTAVLLVQALDDHRHALAAGDAHRLEPVLLVHRLEVVQQRGHDARTGLPERVPQSDRPAVRVELLDRDVALVHDRDD